MAILTAAENTINTIKIKANFATRLLDSINSRRPNPPPLPDPERPASPVFEKLEDIPLKTPPLPPSLLLSLITLAYTRLLYIIVSYYYIYQIKKQSIHSCQYIVFAALRRASPCFAASLLRRASLLRYVLILVCS